MLLFAHTGLDWDPLIFTLPTITGTIGVPHHAQHFSKEMVSANFTFLT
jgi:hypothetical protein